MVWTIPLPLPIWSLALKMTTRPPSLTTLARSNLSSLSLLQYAPLFCRISYSSFVRSSVPTTIWLKRSKSTHLCGFLDLHVFSASPWTRCDTKDISVTWMSNKEATTKWTCIYARYFTECLSSTFVIQLNLAGVGISVVDKTPRELLYMSLTKLSVEMNQTQKEVSLEVILKDMQIDNQLYSTEFPVLLQSTNKNEEKPFFHTSIIKSTTGIQSFRSMTHTTLTSISWKHCIL